MLCHSIRQIRQMKLKNKTQNYMASRFSFYSFPGYEFLRSKNVIVFSLVEISFLISTIHLVLVKISNVFLISILFQISKMAFLLVTITFMIPEINIVTGKSSIIDIKK